MKKIIKILIFDEEPANILLIKHILKNYYSIFKIYDISNYDNFRKDIENINPDIIFIDYTPQLKNNTTIINDIKFIKHNQDITKIFTIYSTDHRTIEEIFDLGANDYILKPYRQIEIVKKLDNYKNQIFYKQFKIKKEQLIAAKNTSGAILHELNQPLNVISMLTDLYKEKYGDNDIISKIKINLNKINNLMESFLNISEYKTKNYIYNTNILDIKKNNKNIKKYIFIIINSNPDNNITRIIEPLLDYNNIPFIKFNNTFEINKNFLDIKNVFLFIIDQYNKDEILNFIAKNKNIKYILFSNELPKKELKQFKQNKVVNSIDNLYDLIFYENF